MSTPVEFEKQRSALFGLAYRMLGSAMDAEDILQEAYLRWQDVPESEIRSPRSYLMTIVSRLCVDRLRLAHVQREEYIGPWLPEPYQLATEITPEGEIELGEAISTAFLLMLERLSPLGRAVFLLHEVFGYTFSDIAKILDISPEYCRQVGHRARKHLLKGRPRFEVNDETVVEVVKRFLNACRGDSASPLLEILAPDVQLTTDSGGKVPSLVDRLVGSDQVADLLIKVFSLWSPTVDVHISSMNGQPALISCLDGNPECVITFDIHDGRISSIYTVLNPDKLKSISCAQD